MLRIELKRSYIGVPQKQRRVLEALGLRKIGHKVEQPDTKATMGMVRRVAHLVTVEKVD